MIQVYGPPLAPPVENARWTLERMERAYEFQPAAAGISAFRSWWNRVPIELPLMFVDGRPHGGFRESFALLHGALNASSKTPLPKPDAVFAEMLFCDLFGPGVRSFYRTMLDHPALLKPQDGCCYGCRDDQWRIRKRRRSASLIKLLGRAGT